VCGATDATPWKERSIDRPLHPADLRITDKTYGATLALNRCARCGFLFASSDELDELTSLYERLEDPGYEETQRPRLLQMQSLLRWARAVVPHARTLLDVGAGAGILVAEARREGLEAVGVEPSLALAANAARLNGAHVVQGTLPHPVLHGRTFDLVTLVDVIEHVSDPVGLLRECARYMAPGGAILVVTPDVESVAARVLGRRWWHFRLAHVGYFSARTLRLAANAAGLEPRAWTRPRWYFPVSYLAERVAQYLPLGALNRAATRVRPLRWLYARVVPLDLRDSYTTLLRPRTSTRPTSALPGAAT
jgi:2-polyprenyl-3-methyl-5-hydroxy-6-metoxy-1,4-benzoquinol methylase